MDGMGEEREKKETKLCNLLLSSNIHTPLSPTHRSFFVPG